MGRGAGGDAAGGIGRSGPDTDWALVLADGDEPDPDMLETLMRAQAASGADAVTCGVRSGAGVTLFAGETGGLGVVGNHFGGAALVRPTVLEGDGRRVWPLLARLSARGLRIASVPLHSSVACRTKRQTLSMRSLRSSMRNRHCHASSARSRAWSPGSLRTPSAKPVDVRRVAVVASEVLGMPGIGGPGTADSLLALALAHAGHRVELLVAPGREVVPIAPEWEQRYSAANVNVRRVEPARVRPDFLAPSRRSSPRSATFGPTS